MGGYPPNWQWHPNCILLAERRDAETRLGAEVMPLRILVAIQNASPGEGSFSLAADWACRFQGSIVGLGIVDESAGAPASMLTGGAASLGNIAMADAEALRSKAERSVAQALDELETHCREAGIEYRQVAKAGDPEEVIGAEAQSCDVVLLGQAAPPDPEFGVPARTILESTLRNSPRPVVVVPRHLQSGKGVLVAYDGSIQAARALQAMAACDLVRLGPITVMGVHHDSENAAREHVGRAVDYLAGHGLTADGQVVASDESVERAIIGEAQARGAELIVMGAYGHSRLAQFLLGSITTKVLDGATAPVFLFH